MDVPAKKKILIRKPKDIVQVLPDIAQVKIDIPEAIKRDFQDIRSNRQKNNNKSVYESILNDDKTQFNNKTNKKEVDRTIDELEMTFDDIWKKSREDNTFCKLFASRVSVCASRQGSNDETEQIQTCNLTAMKCGVNIKNLSATAYRPTKDGQILSGAEIKKMKIQKDCCLKSFDASIDGKMKGYISAKVAYGSGGHQDNVFEELDTVAEWWSKYKSNTEEYLVILVDTDLHEKFARIKDKYAKVSNIMVCSHYHFQEYIITNYFSKSE